MGAGDRFKAGKSGSSTGGFGIFYSKFPFEHTVSIHFVIWYISYGFGKVYHD